MNRYTIFLAAIAAFLSLDAHSQDLGLGELVIDGPGLDIVGVELKIAGTAGPLSYDSSATLEYREQGSATWRSGPDLMRIRPDLGTDLARDEGFAGALWGLNPDTTYELRITVTEPTLGTETVGATVTTRRMTPESSNRAATIVVDAADARTKSEIQAILDGAGPGDIIEFRGVHRVDGLLLNPRGSENNPITIRGDGTGVVGDPTGDGMVFWVLNDNWVIEDLRIEGRLDGDVWAVRVDGRTGRPLRGFTMRRCEVISTRGLRAWEGSVGEIYGVVIHDNIFTGRWSWDDVVTLKNDGEAQGQTGINSTWADTGLIITGQGHSIFNNTLSGFGDGVKTDRRTSIPNAAISYSRNRILWGGDDGIELDDAFRNVVATENLVTNTGTGGSKQPNFISGGPNYFVRNVFANQFLRPFKFNDGPNGVRLLHNTIVGQPNFNGNRLWIQYDNGRIENLDVLNNLFVYVNGNVGNQLVKIDANLIEERWDGNAYWPDGGFEFRYFGSAGSFASAQSNGSLPGGYGGNAFESSGILLSRQPFENGVGGFGTGWMTFVEGFDPRLLGSSSAVAGAVPLNGFTGQSRGAVEFGQATPVYGARISPQGMVRPRPPSDLSAEP